MKIIKPWVEVRKFDGLQIMKNLELAAKQCYRTTGNITDESYKNFLRNCINRGHESVLEHEKVTVRLCCDIGVYKDLTRHRFASFSIESTRYCNYSKDKFENELKFIEPLFFNDKNPDELIDQDEIKNSLRTKYWKECMENIECAYLQMSRIEGTVPDQLRMILPHSTAAELCMTANIREWRHIFSLRCEKYTHPAVQQVMIPLLVYFKEQMPELFDEIKYNEDFDVSKYAEVKILE